MTDPTKNSYPSHCFMILMISPQFHPLVGGYERAAMRLSQALAAQGAKVTVVAEHRDKRWPREETIDGFNVRRLWCLFRPRVHMVTSLGSLCLFLMLHGRQYQVWHVHQYGLHAVLSIIMGRLLNRPVVMKLTSSGGQGLIQTSSALPLPKLCLAVLSRVDAVVTMTRETRQEAVAFGMPVPRINVIGNGIDTDLFHPVDLKQRSALRKKNNIQARGLVVWVGRLSPEKNPDGLLDAWRLALPRLPDGWRLVVVGDGPMYSTLQEFITEDGTSGFVQFVGRQNNVEEWLAMADIYVMTSHNEGLSNTMLEAMATGLPVVATRVSGTIENIEEPCAGIVVSCGDMAAVANSLVSLATDAGLREQQGRLGLDVIEKRFSLSHITANFLKLYQRLVVKGDKKA